VSTDRREFLGSLLAAGLAPAALWTPAASSPAPSTRQPAPWDVSWVGKISGTHRVVFDSPEVSQGLALLRTLVWFKDYAEVYGTKPADMSAVVVLRHNAIWLIMDDEFWDHHDVGSVVKIVDPKTGKPIRRNPFLGPTPFADLPPQIADEVLKKVLATATVLACNLAFQEVVERVKSEAGGDAGRARAMALRHVVPGVILQPSGVFGVTRAEEAGCHYFLAS
jgi:hypothetical protein